MNLRIFQWTGLSSLKEFNAKNWLMSSDELGKRTKIKKIVVHCPMGDAHVEGFEEPKGRPASTQQSSYMRWSHKEKFYRPLD